MSDLKQQRFFITQFRSPELWNQDFGGAILPPKGSRGEFFQVCSKFWWLLALHGWWLRPSILGLCLHRTTFLCVSPCALLSSCKDTELILNTGDFIWKSRTIWKCCIPKFTFWGSRKMWIWGNTVQLITFPLRSGWECRQTGWALPLQDCSATG